MDEEEYEDHQERVEAEVSQWQRYFEEDVPEVCRRDVLDAHLVENTKKKNSINKC